MTTIPRIHYSSFLPSKLDHWPSLRILHQPLDQKCTKIEDLMEMMSLVSARSPVCWLPVATVPRTFAGSCLTLHSLSLPRPLLAILPGPSRVTWDLRQVKTNITIAFIDTGIGCQDALHISIRLPLYDTTCHIMNFCKLNVQFSSKSIPFIHGFLSSKC